jgi:class 3 adenylate cyclase/tetratricopeptide (TPR) repeat protein
LLELNRNLASQLTAFLCEHHLRQIAADTKRAAPFEERVFGVVLLLDISGFSELTEQYAVRSAEGAEQLSCLLNGYFGRMVSHISSHGGDIIGFAGDAVLALWSADSQDKLIQPALQAAQTAMEIQGEVRNPESAGLRLVQRIGIGAGGLSLLQLGGLEGEWSFLVAGDAVRAAGLANQKAGTEEVVLSREAWQLVEFCASGTQLNSGEIRLTKIAPPLHALPPRSPVEMAVPVEVLARCVPRIVLERLASGHAAWLSEFRTLTVLFIQLRGIEPDALGEFERLNRAIETVQKQLAHFEGSLYQFLMDDKGLVLLAVFGFPPLAHEDDAARGVRAALALRADLNLQGVTTSVSVATGRAFCGVYGGEFRQQYSAVGPVMNVAARLMQETPVGIVVDEATQKTAAGIGIVFDPPRRLHLKGMQQLLAAYSPSSDSGRIVGRLEERSVLNSALQNLARERGSAVIVLEGESGIGKSELIELLQQLAREAHVACFGGKGDAIESSTPYHIWSTVYRSLLQLDAFPDDPEMQRRHVLEKLADSEFYSLAPLLNAILPLQIPETELTSQMSGQVRGENTSRLLTGLLQEFACTAPVIMMFDDMQWADSASWALALQVAQSVEPIMMVVSLRPILPTAAPEYHRLLGEAKAIHLRLRLFSKKETEELLRRRLNVESLPNAVSEFIHQKTGGQPYFAEQLIYALRDASLICISGAVCILNLETGQDLDRALEQLQIPRTVEGVVTARLDRLDPAQQLVLKVASVIGIKFSVQIIREIYPYPLERERMPVILNELEGLDLIHRTGSSRDDFEFKHAITRDVVYAGVAFGKRRELHRTIAEWYESNHENRESLLPLLAHHLEQAGQPARAMIYAAQAGEIALHNFANVEAVRFLKRALELNTLSSSNAALRDALHGAQGARWEILLGRASVNLSLHAHGRDHLARGLAFYGERLPTSRAGLGLGLIVEFLRQVMHRVRATRVSGLDAHIARFRECAAAYEGLVEILYLQKESLGSLFCALKSLNLAEKAGAVPERARGYATLGALFGFIPLRSIAGSYFRMALEIAEQEQDLPALEWVLLSIGVYDIGIGKWERASAGIHRGLDIAEQLGDSRRSDDLRQILACVLFHTGDIVSSIPLLEHAQKMADVRGDNRLAGEVVRWKAYCLLLLGRYEELRSCLDELYRLRTGPSLTGEVFQLSDVFALRAAWHLRRGRDQDALEAAREATQRLQCMPHTFHDLLLERVMVADVFLRLWEKRTSASGTTLAGDIGLLRDEAGRACRALRHFSRVFTIGMPYACLAAGQFESLSGHSARAEVQWRAALVGSQRLHLLWAQGRACYELGRHASEHSPERQEWLDRGRHIFARINSPYERAAIENVLAGD